MRYTAVLILLLSFFALAEEEDEFAELNAVSVISGCPQFLGEDSGEPCHQSGELGSLVKERITGKIGAEFVEDGLEISEELFKELIREKVLSRSIQHMVLRDGIDLANNGDAWETVDRHNDGTLGTTTMSIGQDCTRKFPQVDKVRHNAVQSLFFTFDKEKVRQKNKKLQEAVDKLVIGGAPSGLPGCEGEIVCMSLGERALIAYERAEKLEKLNANPDLTDRRGGISDRIFAKVLPESWQRSSYQKDAITEHDTAIGMVLANDPALNELIETEPGACAPNAPKDIKWACQRAYDVIGGYEQVFRKYNTNPSKADIKKHNNGLSEIYQEANRKMKEKVLGAIRLACSDSFDPSDMLLSQEISKDLLNEYPEFSGVYCRMLNEKLEDRKWDQRKQTALQVASWGAAGAGVVATIFSGGMAAPLAASVTSGTTMAANYWLKAEGAHRDMLSAGVRLGAGDMDPRTVEKLAAAEKEFRKKYKIEIAKIVISIGVTLTSKAALEKLTDIKIKISDLQKAGKISAATGELFWKKIKKQFVDKIKEQGQDALIESTIDAAP